MNSEKKWIKRYADSTELVEKSFDAVVAFNANIDVVHEAEEINLELEDVEPELRDGVENISDLKKSLKYCIVKGENHEIDLKADPDFKGEKRIGGQAGIMSQFLSGTGNGTIFYTPLLSEELSSQMNEKILYPVNEGGLLLKNVQDASNTDRTKRNHIFEFDREKSGRLIVSDTLKGFGPYFRKGVADNLDTIEDNADCVLTSGFHDIKGNATAKLKKSAEQLSQIKSPLHLEYVHRNDKLSQKILKHVVPCVKSIGLDETEFKKVVDLVLDEELDNNVNLGKAYQHSKKLLETLGLERIHIHTYRYHLTVTVPEYHCSREKIREAMLYGELAAIQSADTGKIPETSEIKEFDMEDKRLHRLHELKQFGDHLDLKEFERTGTAEIDGLNVVAIPTIIHEDPVRTVGMGDILSSAAFGSEFTEKP